MKQTRICGLFVILAVLLFVPLAGHAQTEEGTEPIDNNDIVSSFAECVEEGGVVRTIELQSFPPRQQTLCTTKDGLVFREGVPSPDPTQLPETSTTTNRQGLIRERFETQQEHAEQLREQLRDRRENLQEDLSERREHMRERAHERIGFFAERMLTRFEAAIVRLADIASRVQSRIDKLTERGFDLSQAQELLDTAQEHITDASSLLEETKSDVAEALAEAESAEEDKLAPLRETFQGMQELLAEMKDTVRTAHQALVDSVRAIKTSAESNASQNDTNTDDNNDVDGTTDEGDSADQPDE